MIKINKPAEAPEVLRTRGKERTRALCEAYDNGQTEFRSDEFNRSIYSNRNVRQLLHSIQQGKCCYCEVPINVKYSQVEHFRPKTHYYWLAYDWSNLLFACGDCNSAKGERFPLKNPRSKAKSHHDQISCEKALLINPANVNPSRYIAFDNHKMVQINNSLIGKMTIETLDLNRESLLILRQEILDKFEALISVSKQNIPERLEAKRKIRKLLKASSLFTAAVRAKKRELDRTVQGPVIES